MVALSNAVDKFDTECNFVCTFEIRFVHLRADSRASEFDAPMRDYEGMLRILGTLDSEFSDFCHRENKRTSLQGLYQAKRENGSRTPYPYSCLQLS